MNYYAYWDSDVALSKYKTPRLWSERFRSEVHYLKQIAKSGMSILDVGCATGDLYLGLKEVQNDIKYTGLDIANNVLQVARALSPDATFILGNILEDDVLKEEERFDIVIATGIFQHEPEYERLLNRMLALSKRYVLFDLKICHTNPTICNIEEAYCDHDEPVYFIVLNIHELKNMLLNLPKIGLISLFGYYSGTNKCVRLPQSLNEPVCSAHVLLEKTNGHSETLELEMNLPKRIVHSA